MATGSPSGVYAMLFAMFDEIGAVRPDALLAQVDAAFAARSSGIAVLGLGTEVGKLSLDERRWLVQQTAEACAGRLPFCVSIAGRTVSEQTEFARFARGCGAEWVILQPPPEKVDEDALITFFGATADALDCPVAIQNAPQFLGYGLSQAGLHELSRRHGNASIVKAEADAVDIRRLVEHVEGRMAVFNGRAGLELTDTYRAGAVGMIPGIETIDLQARCTALWRAGDLAEAEATYRLALPAISFVMQSLNHFIAYGKMLAALRLGLDLAPQTRSAIPVDPFGLEITHRLAGELGPLPR